MNTQLEVEAGLKIEKLRCEIRQLEGQLGVLGKLATLTPLISAVVAVFGVWLSLHQFSVQQTTTTERIA